MCYTRATYYMHYILHTHTTYTYYILHTTYYIHILHITCYMRHTHATYYMHIQYQEPTSTAVLAVRKADEDVVKRRQPPALIRFCQLGRKGAISCCVVHAVHLCVPMCARACVCVCVCVCVCMCVCVNYISWYDILRMYVLLRHPHGALECCILHICSACLKRISWLIMLVYAVANTPTTLKAWYQHTTYYTTLTIPAYYILHYPHNSSFAVNAAGRQARMVILSRLHTYTHTAWSSTADLSFISILEKFTSLVFENQ
jgi:hypothetical protein